jgi:hypothetical protein
MTRSEPVRFMRTEATMAYPDGRLLAVTETALHVLAPDGWAHLSVAPPPHADALSREDAEDWCERHDWDLALLDAVPREVG